MSLGAPSLRLRLRLRRTGQLGTSHGPHGPDGPDGRHVRGARRSTSSVRVRAGPCGSVIVRVLWPSVPRRVFACRSGVLFPQSPLSCPERGLLTVTRDERDALYWRKNIRMVLALLVLWAIPPFALSIFGVELLDRFRLGGFPLGFWFAQQGSIVLFVVLILVYALYMDRLDRAFRGEGEEES
ncbi:MAG: DUF4212 domain-containing protein [Candidatus Sumerlaeia bacterium]|nr:DUF4212 domain-containing protein [Candidatus Sumerlaeia bacterium]